MTMVSFKQRKGKETILRQINARNPDQVLHPHWENWGRRWELRNHIPLILPKPKHFCTRGAYPLPPVQLLGSIHFLLPALNVVLFGQEGVFTHCSFKFIVWPANWRQTSPTHRIMNFFLSTSGDRRNKGHTCTHISVAVSTFRQAPL